MIGLILQASLCRAGGYPSPDHMALRVTSPVLWPLRSQTTLCQQTFLKPGIPCDPVQEPSGLERRMWGSLCICWVQPGPCEPGLKLFLRDSHPWLGEL